MKKFKPFIGAIIALIFALTLIAGSTYALFTNKAEDDVLITAGKVNVKTTIVKGSIKTYSADPSSGIYEKAYQIDDDDSDNAWPFANNGRVLFDDLSLSAITIDRMTPLDGVEFKVSFVPNSNVSIKYRTIIYVLGAEDTGLASALNYKIDGTTYYGMYESNKIYSKWKELIWDNETSSFTGDIADINFDITLPSYGYADDFQDKQCKLHIAIEAVQWNTIVVIHLKIYPHLYKHLVL